MRPLQTLFSLPPASFSVVALAVVALMLTTACAPAGDIRVAEPVGQIEAPQFELVAGRTSIERFDPPGAGTGLELTIGALVRNPNRFGITLERISYRVVVSGVEVTVGELGESTFLEPGGTVPVQFDIRTDLDARPRLLRAILRAFADEPLPFEVLGTVAFTSPSYAFETRDRLLLAGSTLARQTLEQPRLRLDERASRVYLLRADVPVIQIVMEVTNPGDIGYFLYGRDLELALGGVVVGTEDLPPIPIPAGESSRIDLLFYPVPARLSDTGARVLDAALAGIPTLVALTGELKLDVLGVDTFDVSPSWVVRGFIDADR